MLEERVIRPSCSLPEKTVPISTLPPPTTAREVRSFLGSKSYYRTSIPNYAKIVEPLTELIRRNVRIEWNPTRKAAFDQLKRELVSNRIMARRVPTAPANYTRMRVITQ